MPQVYLNGKFLAQRTTGVQRVAAQLVTALDGQVAGAWVLLCPPGVNLPALRRIVARPVGPAGLPLHLWEQLVLPRAAADGLLVNLSGSAPAFARRQICLLHDAAVFDHPEAYTKSFVAWYRWLFRRLARHAAALLTVSTFSRDRLTAHLHLAADRFAVVPNGADHLDGVTPDDAVIDRFGLRGVPYLLAVGSANPTKNLDALVAAFALLGGTEQRLVIVGGSDARVFAGGPGPDGPGVIRTGPLGDAALKALYGHALALVFPSRYEGFGLPPLEAMACGCPVVAARAAALPEVCGDAALYVDPGSVEAIAAAMRRVLDDGALREAGRRRATGFRWAAAAAAVARLVSALQPAEGRP
jgi:glycosyltransferase involved in cell wall biosynthesis